MAPKLSHRVKFARALHHIEDLDSQVRVWRHDDANAPFCELDPTDPRYQIVYVDIAPIPLEQFSPTIGDVVQNLRASLDHLIFQLGRAHADRLTDAQTKALHFPVVVNAAKFARVRAECLSTISPEACAVVEKLQPYNGTTGDGYEMSFLWHLHRLAIADKHHALAVVAAVIEEWKIRERGSGPDIDRSDFTFMVGNALVGRTPVARVPFYPATRDGEVKMEIEGGLTVAFKDPPSAAVAEESAGEVLAQIATFIERVVFPDLERFL